MSKTILQIAAEFEAKHIEQYPDMQLGLCSAYNKRNIMYSPILRLEYEGSVFVYPHSEDADLSFRASQTHYLDTFSINPSIVQYTTDAAEFEQMLEKIFQFAKQDL